jgi:hypothetical protein
MVWLGFGFCFDLGLDMFVYLGLVVVLFGFEIE